MIRVLVLISLSLFLIQCEEQETDDLYSAQLCLNTADSTTVDTCLAKIAGNGSPQAYGLRCGADFIKANITDAKIVSSLERIEDNNDDNSKDPMAEMMAFMTFKSVEDAQAAVANCTAAGSSGMLGLARMSLMAVALITDLMALDPTLDPSTGNGVDPTALHAALDSANAGTLSAATKEILGATVVASYSDYCGESGQFKGESICVNLTNSINAGSTNAAIAEALLEELKDDN